MAGDDINRTIASSGCFCRCVLLTSRKCGKIILASIKKKPDYMLSLVLSSAKKRSFHGMEENLLSFHPTFSEDVRFLLRTG